MSPIRRARALAVLASAVVVLSACSGEEPSTPTAAETTTTDTSASTSDEPTPPPSTSATTSADNSELAVLDPCDMLTSDELSQLDLSEGTRHDIGSIPRCEWDSPGGADGASVGVNFELTGGLDDLEPVGDSKLSDIEVNGRQARKVEASDGSGHCRIDLAVTEDSMVTVGVLIFDELAESCALVQQIAEFVEPKLPRG